MTNSLARRQFLRLSAATLAAATIGLRPAAQAAANEKPPLFRISLAQWSLHNNLFQGKLDNRDFAKVAKTQFDIDAIEYVNQFFKDKAEDQAYLSELKKRQEEHNVSSLLIMIDGEGALGDSDPAKRKQAVENHYKWVTAAKTLGCHSIRVNAQTLEENFEEAQKLAADGLRQLCQFAAPHNINVIVENHGGLSSHGKWLQETIKNVGLPNCGTLPDFGNFYQYDRYQGVTDLMGTAFGVSAKSYDFDAQGNETQIDYAKMLKIVLDAGYNGYIGIEYEGNGDEYAGIRATKKLLEKLRNQMSA